MDHANGVGDAQHNDLLRVEHVEGYHDLSTKTKACFSTIVAKWDAHLYVMVYDDVHVNLGTNPLLFQF